MRVAHILVCHSFSPLRLFESIPSDDEADWYIFLHGQSLEIAEQATQFCRERNGTLFPYMRNRGLARSWNDAIAEGRKAGCKAFMFLNDDLFFYKNCYVKFVEFVRSNAGNKTCGLLTVRGLESGLSMHSGQIHAQSFACGAITRDCVESVGYFDENFIPAYYEDSDYFARLEGSGLRTLVDDRVLVEHERSSTSRSLSTRDLRLLREAHQRNRAYMIRKWGSDVPPYPYSHPFNDPAYDMRIEQARRARPYASYDIIPEVRSSYVYRDEP